MPNFTHFLVLVQFSGRYKSFHGVSCPHVTLLEGSEETLGLARFFCRAASDATCLTVIKSLAQDCSKSEWHLSHFYCLCLPLNFVCAHRWAILHPAAQGMYVNWRSLVTATRKMSDQTLTQLRGSNALAAYLVAAASREQLSASRGMEFSGACGQLSLSFKRGRIGRSDPRRDSLRWTLAVTVNSCTDTR